MTDDYTPLRPPRHESPTLNQRRYHVLRWGEPHAPRLFLLHGWMDCAATFQFVVDALGDGWQCIAPDWRGFGDSQWNEAGYYSPDYLADLDALLEHYSPDQPATVVGHSMGAMIAGLYAGVRPERVARLVLVEGFGLPDARPAEAPGRYARWLREAQQAPAFTPHPSLDDVAARLLARNPGMRGDHARHMAAALCRHDADGQLVYRADPHHKRVNPVLYRLEEAMACWRRITCPVLWVWGEGMAEHPRLGAVMGDLDARRACFARLDEAHIAGAGHMVQWEQPTALAQQLRHWLKA